MNSTEALSIKIKTNIALFNLKKKLVNILTQDQKNIYMKRIKKKIIVVQLANILIVYISIIIKLIH